MPRIELIPVAPEDATVLTSPVIDVCHGCAAAFQEHHPIPLIANLAGEHRSPTDCLVGSIDVDHPPYEAGDYSCEICGRVLRQERDG